MGYRCLRGSRDVEKNRDGSDRFLADHDVYVRLKSGHLVKGTVAEYSEDGQLVSVYLEGRSGRRDFPVEQLVHPPLPR